VAKIVENVYQIKTRLLEFINKQFYYRNQTSLKKNIFGRSEQLR